ncbi:hypothetical protein CKM354_000177400 [Cercospora kikuchii]|uniref:Uncharacterized protein n=1 Tax=Cercospora kikuchii TaxID=84275 RepID=A0A9P3FDA3_9PEZI|nr:uncharacterized protein CKM354_000177400 [Cercospora kikuchii]GIZ38355.1 hypothetical protein CKM354_000177400 [Cercospora kikuchii]
MSSKTKTPASSRASARRAAEQPYRAAQLRRIRKAYTDFYLSRRDYINRLKKEAAEGRTVVAPPLAGCLATLNECTLYELSNIAQEFECKAREMAQRYEALINGFIEELERKHREEFERWEKTTVYNCGEHSQEEGRPSNCEDGYEEMDEESDVEEDADGLERLTTEVADLRVEEKAVCADSAMGKTPPLE